MARGMVVGEKIQSQAGNEQFRAGYDRAGLGKGPKDPGQFVWRDGKLRRTSEVEMDRTRMANRANVIVGRQYENVPSPRGDHIFTGRTDYNRYMKANNLTNASDYTETWAKAEKKRAEGFSSAEQKRDRRDRIGRRLYEVSKMEQRRYDAEVRQIERKRRERGTAEVTKE